MTRLSDEQLNDMTLRQLKAYSDTNSPEGLRIAKQCRNTAKYAAKKYRADRDSKILEALGFSHSLLDTDF